ncbi:hypothetical protein NE237_001823 [Protea cynaroides]|uniref:Uncharacterized protein n=1 Tax=Protea cynaroides TaxID=273540 RepID=A0A9Q0KTU3_9MAGN|nr:hypothetical protein NE237_001823 [Protea cynaroides]
MESLEELHIWGGYKLSEANRKMLGKGRLVDNVGKCQGSKSIADDEIYYHGSSIPILCVVFAFKTEQLIQGEPQWKTRCLRPKKEVHLLDNDDVALLDDSLNLTLSTPNINDDIQGFPSAIVTEEVGTISFHAAVENPAQRQSSHCFDSSSTSGFPLIFKKRRGVTKRYNSLALHVVGLVEPTMFLKRWWRPSRKKVRQLVQGIIFADYFSTRFL